MLNKINNKKTTQEKVNFKFQFFSVYRVNFFCKQFKIETIIKKQFFI